jgi:hypothetical protein
VDDILDNCPSAANADQHDEDGDGVGDVCDVCPGDADSGQADGDGDGVGDVCDPRPAQAGDRLLVFDPFTRLDPAWTIVSGGWLIEDDALVTPSTDRGQLLRRDDITAARLAIRLRATVAGFVGTDVHNVGIVTTLDATNSGVMCDGIGASGITDRVAVHSLQNNTAGNPLVFESRSPVPLGAPFRLTHQDLGGTIECRVADAAATATTTFTVPARQDRGVGIRSNRMASRIDYVAIWEVGP